MHCARFGAPSRMRDPPGQRPWSVTAFGRYERIPHMLVPPNRMRRSCSPRWTSWQVVSINKSSVRLGIRRPRVAVIREERRRATNHAETAAAKPGAGRRQTHATPGQPPPHCRHGAGTAAAWSRPAITTTFNVSTRSRRISSAAVGLMSSNGRPCRCPWFASVPGPSRTMTANRSRRTEAGRGHARTVRLRPLLSSTACLEFKRRAHRSR